MKPMRNSPYETFNCWVSGATKREADPQGTRRKPWAGRCFVKRRKGMSFHAEWDPPLFRHIIAVIAIRHTLRHKRHETVSSDGRAADERRRTRRRDSTRVVRAFV